MEKIISKFEPDLKQSIALVILSISLLLNSFNINAIAWPLFIIGVINLLFSFKFNIGVWISSGIFLVFILFKITHWPGANTIFIFGFCLLYLSLFLQLKRSSYQFGLPILNSLFILLLLILLGKIGYNFPEFLIWIALGVFLMSYSLRYLKKANKNFQDRLKLLLFYSFSFYSIFYLFHWPYKLLFLLTSVFFLWLWIIPRFLKIKTM